MSSACSYRVGTLTGGGVIQPLGWGWQDFSTPGGTSLTLTANENGNNVTFNSTKIISSTAVIVRKDNPDSFAYSGAIRLFSTKISVSSHTADSITLNAIPHASWGDLRVYYLYNYGVLPINYTLAPKFIRNTNIVEIDNLFVTEEEFAAQFPLDHTNPADVMNTGTKTHVEIDDHITDTIIDDHTQYALLDGRNSDILKIGAINEVNADTGVTVEDRLFPDVFIDSKEPTGFNAAATNKGNLSFNDGNRTFTHSLSGGQPFDLWIYGKRFVKSASETLVISDVEGKHYVYYDEDGILQESVNPDIVTLFIFLKTEAFVALIYWNATDNEQVWFTDKRHENQMDGATQAWIAFIEGTQAVLGGVLFGFSVDGDGSNNNHAKFTVSGTGYIVADLPGISFGGSTGQAIYRTGSFSYWRKIQESGYFVVTDTTAGVGSTGRLVYNKKTGSSWGLSTVTDGYFVNCHIVVYLGASGSNFGSVIGSNEYATLEEARLGIADEIFNMSTSILPDPEHTFLGTAIFQTSSGFTNDVKAIVASTDYGEDYMNLLPADFNGTHSPIPHYLFNNLDNDDHYQYAKLSGRDGDELLIDDINEFTADHGIDIEGTNLKDKHIKIGDGTTFLDFYSKEGDIYSENGKAFLGNGINVRAEQYGIAFQARESSPAKTLSYAGIDATFTAATKTITKIGETFVSDGVLAGDFAVLTSGIDASLNDYTGATGEILEVTETTIVISAASAGAGPFFDLTEVGFVVINEPIFSVLDNGDIHMNIGPSPEARLHIESETGANIHAIDADIFAGIDGHAGFNMDFDADDKSGTTGFELNYNATQFDNEGKLGQGFRINVDNTGATAGDFHGMEVSLADPSNTDVEVEAIATNQGVAPIAQYLAEAASLDVGYVYDASLTAYTDRTTEFDSAVSDIQIFAENDDQILLAATAKFSISTIALAVNSSQSIIPTFEYVTDAGAWVLFSASDGTNGFTQPGSITWESDDLTTWGQRTVNEVTGDAGAVDYYWIRITRNRAVISPNVPTESIIGISTAGAKFEWDSVGNINCNTIAVSDGITEPDTIVGQGIIYVDSADGSLKIKFGDGTVKTIVTD